jgi:hypothetical protein
MQIDDDVLDVRGASQLLQATDHRDELRMAWLRRLIEDTGQAGKANRLNCQNPNADGTTIRRSGFHGPLFGCSKGLPWDRHTRVPESLVDGRLHSSICRTIPH